MLQLELSRAILNLIVFRPSEEGGKGFMRDA